MKKSNMINKDVRINDEVRNETARNTAESSNVNDQIFQNIITDGNLINSKIRNIHTTIKFNTCRSNRLIEIKNSLSNIDRKTNITNFATINEILIEKI